MTNDRPPFGVRLLDLLAGLLSAGILVLGALLLLSAVLSPALLAAAGLGDATGPGWLSVSAHLLVGVIGELVVRLRRRWSTGFRCLADAAVIAAALAVIWFSWLP